MYNKVRSPTDNSVPTDVIISVFEVLNDPKTYKNGNIIVVTDESILLLRYMVLINEKSKVVRDLKLSGVLDEIFRRHNKWMARNIDLDVKLTKTRSENEINKILEKGEYIIEKKVLDSVESYNLYLQSKNNNCLIYEIRFPEGYPTFPPIIILRNKIEEGIESKASASARGKASASASGKALERFISRYGLVKLDDIVNWKPTKKLINIINQLDKLSKDIITIGDEVNILSDTDNECIKEYEKIKNMIRSLI